ncbi:MAG: hypothetical protein ABIB47_06280 [Candidatus Woesearchaeota archaeon]
MKTNVKLAILFILIAIAMVVVGIIRNDYLFYIRAIIFSAAAIVAYFVVGKKQKKIKK